MERMHIETLGLKLALVFSHMFITMSDAKFAISSGSVYVNGAPLRNHEFQLQSGDSVQLVVTYYMYARILQSFECRRAMLSSGIKLINAMLKLKSGDAPQYDDIEDCNKSLSALRLQRALRIYYVTFDIPNYIELDFISLSFVVVFEPMLLEDFDYFVVRRSALTYSKMLNWKYIN